MKDLLIVGGGPAGLSAAIYAARYLMDTLVVAEKVGGTLMDSPLVENYPGFKRMSGYDLMEKIEEHLKEYDVPIIEEKVEKVLKVDSGFLVETKEKTYEGKTLILATGWKRRKLKAKNAEKFDHKGISYCATCDAALFRDKIVAVVGGGDAGVGAALMLSDYAKKVYLIEMLDTITAEPIKKKLLERNEKIMVLTSTRIVEVKGDNWVRGLVLDSGKSLSVEGIFVEIGGTPNTQIAESLGVKLNEKKEIVVDNYAKTSVPGVFAAGDATNIPFKQAIVGAGYGAIAAWSAYNYLRELRAK